MAYSQICNGHDGVDCSNNIRGGVKQVNILRGHTVILPKECLPTFTSLRVLWHRQSCSFAQRIE